jgi:hypothetical protein
MEKIREYLASQYGVTGATLDYVVLPDIEVKPEAEDPSEGYETVDQEMTSRVPHTGRFFVNDRCKVWETISNIFGKHSCFVYIKPALRNTYMLLFDHFLGPNNVGNMASAAETKLTGTLYNRERNFSPEKPMSESILNNIQSSMDLKAMDMLVLMTPPRLVT